MHESRVLGAEFGESGGKPEAHMKAAIFILSAILSVSALHAERPIDWKPTPAIEMILSAAELDAGLPIGLAHCVAYAESRFHPTAMSRPVNGYRSCGLMQLNRRYLYGARGIADRFSSAPDFQWDDPAQNAEVGCRYLAWLIDRFGGSVYLGLVAYNWGPSNVQAIGEWDNIPKEVRRYADGILSMLDEMEGWKEAGR